MRAHSRLVAATAILFVAFPLFASSSEAQQRTLLAGSAAQMGAPRSSAVVHTRPAATHVVTQRADAPAAPRRIVGANAGVHFNPAVNSFQADDDSFVPWQDLLNPVPGLGFDYHHLSVVNQDLLVKAAIDPVTQLKVAEARRLLSATPFAGPGLFLWDGGAYYPISDESGPEQPAAEQASQPEAQQQPQRVVVQAPNAQQAQSTSGTSAEEQLPDVGQFVLVLRNGSKVQAVAFTHVNDRIVYITTDGSKRSIAVADLNPEATIKLNEERGTPLQLSL